MCVLVFFFLLSLPHVMFACVSCVWEEFAGMPFLYIYLSQKLFHDVAQGTFAL